MCHHYHRQQLVRTVQLALFCLSSFGAIPSLCQLLGTPGGCAPIGMLGAQPPNGGGPQAQFQQPFGPAFGCPLNPLGAFGRQFPPPPPPGAGGGQFPPMHGGQTAVNVNPTFMGSQQQQQNGAAANGFGTGGSNCNCGTCCPEANNFVGMPTSEFGGFNTNINSNNNLNGIANGGGVPMDMVNGGGGMGVFGRRRRR